MNKFKRSFICLAVFSMIIFSGQAGRAQEILVGFSGPLSSIGAEYGQDISTGIELAIKDINDRGGVLVGGKKYTFRLDKKDDRFDPTQALNNARRFRSEGAIAVFSGVLGTTLPMMQINQEKGNEFLMLAFTSAPSITEMGNKLLITTGVPFTINADIYAEWAKAKGYKTCAMVVTLGPYGDDWRRVFRAVWEKKGGTITADKPANYYMETDFSAPLTAALATRPDFLLVGGPSGATALVIEQARSLGFKGGFVFIDQAKMDVVAQMLKGNELIGNAIAIAGMKTMPDGEAKRFALRYEGIYKRMATWECTVNYVLMHSLARAIVAAQSVDDVYKIRTAYAKALPMNLPEFPMEILGVSDQGRWRVFTSIQAMNSSKLDVIMQYAWWVKSEAEFSAASKLSKMHTQGIVQKWHKTAD